MGLRTNGSATSAVLLTLRREGPGFPLLVVFLQGSDNDFAVQLAFRVSDTKLCRGRGRRLPGAPARTRTWRITSYGSYLGSMTING